MAHARTHKVRERKKHARTHALKLKSLIARQQIEIAAANQKDRPTPRGPQIRHEKSEQSINKQKPLKIKMAAAAIK